MQEQDATQFEILNRVDVGGMAEIFRARNLSNGQIMAIKRILPSLAGQPNFVNMFIDEAAVCMALHHPNIVRVEQIGLMDDALFLSMEFVDGTNLREVLSYANQNNYHIPIHEALRIAIHVLDGLDYAHHLCNEAGEALNLIHRDVSPPNILLGYNNDVKITDFGLVKSKAQVSKTVPGLIKGKFSYLSPEAAYGESLDLRSDIYAIGIILWEMLTSRPLFSDPVEMKILDLVRKSIIPSMAQFNPDMTPELEAIVLKGLARHRSDRYSTAKEFADALRKYLEGMGNPKTELGKIVAMVKPPRVDDSGDMAVVPEGASASDETVQPHTRSELIPIEQLRKAAGEVPVKDVDSLNDSLLDDNLLKGAEADDDDGGLPLGSEFLNLGDDDDSWDDPGDVSVLEEPKGSLKIPFVIDKDSDKPADDKKSDSDKHADDKKSDSDKPADGKKSDSDKPADDKKSDSDKPADDKKSDAEKSKGISLSKSPMSHGMDFVDLSKPVKSSGHPSSSYPQENTGFRLTGLQIVGIIIILAVIAFFVCRFALGII